MEQCFRCSRNDDEVRLFDGFYGMESVKVCEKCSLIENMPIIKIHNSEEIDKNGHQTVRERLSHLAGLSAPKKEKSIYEKLKDLENQPELEKPENITFKLVENFHWHVLRERRRKCLSQKQLAEAINENEEVIKMIEKNALPKGALQIIQKLERFLGIKLIKSKGYEKEIVEPISVSLEKDLKEAMASQINTSAADKPLRENIPSLKTEKLVPKFKPEDLPPPFIPVDDDLIAEHSAHFKKMEKEEAEDMLKIAIKEETNPVIIKKEQVAGTPLKLIDFKRHSSEELNLADLKRMQERVEVDSPKKDKIQIGREQTEDFGKDDEIIKKAAYRSYSPTLPKKEAPAKVPSIYDLMKQKQERDKELVGREIDLTREEKDKI